MNRDETKGNNSQQEETKSACGVWVLLSMISAALWLLMFCGKAVGIVSWSWIAVVLSGLWISPAVMAAFTLLAVSAHVFCRATKRHREWKRRRKIAKTLQEAVEGLVLNNIGPIYGVRRQPGEKNRSYKRRILKASRTLDTVNVQNVPTPATGQSLDKIAWEYGIRRFKGETDKQLQERIRQAVLGKLKGGGARGL